MTEEQINEIIRQYLTDKLRVETSIRRRFISEDTGNWVYIIINTEVFVDGKVIYENDDSISFEVGK